MNVHFKATFATFEEGKCYDIADQEASHYIMLGVAIPATLLGKDCNCGCGGTPVVEPIISDVIEAKPLLKKK
jgi:hypothetical protein